MTPALFKADNFWCERDLDTEGFRFPTPKDSPTMAPIGFSDSQLNHVTAAAQQIPPFQRGRLLRRIVKLLRGKSFGDAEVHRAAQTAAQEVRRNRPGRVRGCAIPQAR